MGMGSRQPVRGQNEAFGRNQGNPRGTSFMPTSQPRMGGGKGGSGSMPTSRPSMGSRQPVRGQNEAFGLRTAPSGFVAQNNMSSTSGLNPNPRFNPTQFDPSQFRMSGGKGGYNPSGPIRFDPNAGQEPVDPRFGVDLGPIDPDDIDTRTSEELNQPIDNFDPPLEDPVMEDPAPAPEPYVPYVRPRPTSGLFSDQSGIASLRGQYRAPSMSNPQFQPYRPTQRYQPPQRMPNPPRRMPQPPYGQRPPSGPSKGGRPPAQPPRRMPPPFMPSPYGNPRMPSPYGQPPRGGLSKGGRGPSGPTKGGRPDNRMPQIPFNPPYGG